MLTRTRFAVKFALAVTLLAGFCDQAFGVEFEDLLTDYSWSKPTHQRLGKCDQHRSDPAYPKTRAYLQRIANFVMERNPKVFKGTYSPDEICIVVDKQTRSAAAWSHIGLILVSPQTFLGAFRSEADVAAVLAHELAHIVNQQAFAIPAVYPSLLITPEFAKLRNEHNDRLFKVLTSIRPQIRALEKKLKPLESDKKAYLKAIVESVDYAILELAPELCSDHQALCEKRPSLISQFDIDKGFDLGSELGTLRASVPTNLASEILAVETTYKNLAQKEDLESLAEQMTAFAKKRLGETAFSSWFEEQADIQGYRYFAKAGFKPELYKKWISDASLQAETSYLKTWFPEALGGTFEGIPRTLSGSPSLDDVMAEIKSKN